MAASGKDNLVEMRRLIEAGVNVNCANKACFPLFPLVCLPNTIIRLLRQTGDTPCTTAAYANQEQALRLLKGAGADLDMANKNGFTPVYLAVAKKGESLEALRFLASAGADLDKADNNGFTPASWAAQTNKPAALRFLAEAGADLRKADKLGVVVLFVGGCAGVGV